MQYISWNCKGLGSKPKEEAIKDLVQMSNLEFLLIQKTKMEESETLQASKTF
jgi:exonuclease III